MQKAGRIVLLICTVVLMVAFMFGSMLPGNSAPYVAAFAAVGMIIGRIGSAIGAKKGLLETVGVRRRRDQERED